MKHQLSTQLAIFVMIKLTWIHTNTIGDFLPIYLNHGGHSCPISVLTSQNSPNEPKVARRQRKSSGVNRVDCNNHTAGINIATIQLRAVRYLYRNLKDDIQQNANTLSPYFYTYTYIGTLAGKKFKFILMTKTILHSSKTIITANNIQKLMVETPIEDMFTAWPIPLHIYYASPSFVLTHPLPMSVIRVWIFHVGIRQNVQKISKKLDIPIPDTSTQLYQIPHQQCDQDNI